MSVRKEKADSYYIREENGCGWGRIFVQPGTGARGNSWVYVSAISDYGNYAYLWSSIGGDYRSFLHGVDFDYAMNKLTHGSYMEFDHELAITKLMRWTLQNRREDARITKEDAREFYDLLKEMRDGDHIREAGVFYERMYAASPLFAQNDLWELSFTRPSPQSRAFWERIWQPFVRALKDELTNERATLIALCSPMGRICA